MTGHRHVAAGFPLVKTITEFDLTVSSIPRGTFAYLASPEWITERENVARIGPAGAGNGHTLIAAADLVEVLYRGLADNSVGKVSKPC